MAKETGMLAKSKCFNIVTQREAPKHGKLARSKWVLLDTNKTAQWRDSRPGSPQRVSASAQGKTTWTAKRTAPIFYTQAFALS